MKLFFTTATTINGTRYAVGDCVDFVASRVRADPAAPVGAVSPRREVLVSRLLRLRRDPSKP